MPYNFAYDLSKVPPGLLKRLLRFVYERKLHQHLAEVIEGAIRRFRIDERLGLNLSEAITLMKDLVDVQITNALSREAFKAAKGKALLLPHCARKFMDANCKAEFDAEMANYRCRGCSPDCLVNRATAVAKAKGYDVYVLPGGSCIEKILKTGRYQAVVGVACGYELRLAKELLNEVGLAGQGLILTRNGCSRTSFSLELLKEML